VDSDLADWMDREVEFRLWDWSTFLLFFLIVAAFGIIFLN
jgi:hypothetical protein